MIVLGIVLLVVGIVGWAFHRSSPGSRPLSTIAMYVGLGVGTLLVVIGLILIYVPLGAPTVAVDSSGQIITR